MKCINEGSGHKIKAGKKKELERGMEKKEVDQKTRINTKKRFIVTSRPKSGDYKVRSYVVGKKSHDERHNGKQKGPQVGG